MIKPVCKLTGENGNIFNLVKIASRILYRNNMRDKAIEMQHRVFCSKSYEEALSIISEYVEIE